jgi:hypothetical protein
MILSVILKVSQENAYIGFSIYLFLAVTFVTYINNNVECSDLKFERDMLRTPEGRKQYYHIINSK